MHKLLHTLLAGCALLFCLPSPATETVHRADLGRHFDAAGVRGTFVMLDVAADKLTIYDPERAHRRFRPASSFKILNSLIALETGAVKDENEVLPYGGKPQRFKEWEQDMSMRNGIKVSNVPVYQEVARRVGPSRMDHYVKLVGYGNADIGKVIDRFWLDGPLTISAVEQAHFVGRLAQRRLPFSDRSMTIVRDIIKQEETARHALFAKTGWVFADASKDAQPGLGWWVGWVEREGRVYAFAMNIDIVKDEDAPKRQVITRKCLEDLGAL